MFIITSISGNFLRVHKVEDDGLASLIVQRQFPNPGNAWIATEVVQAVVDAFAQEIGDVEIRIVVLDDNPI